MLIPTITDRDFVVATVAAPTVIKEPEKPAEETTAEGAEGETPAEGAEAATKDGEGEQKKMINLKIVLLKKNQRKKNLLKKNLLKK